MAGVIPKESKLERKRSIVKVEEDVPPKLTRIQKRELLAKESQKRNTITNI